jgi:hypothetical protein
METFCQECRFFQAAGGQQRGSGQCRRFPPVTPQSDKVADTNLAFRTGIWPLVAATSWCGEFQPRDAANKG